jgi:hypothetical protein
MGKQEITGHWPRQARSGQPQEPHGGRPEAQKREDRPQGTARLPAEAAHVMSWEDNGRVRYADGDADTLHPDQAGALLRLLYTTQRANFGKLLYQVVTGEPFTKPRKPRDGQ